MHLDWRLSYQNPITNIISSPLCHWNTSTYNFALNNVLLAADLVARHKANPRTNSKTVYNRSFKIHGNRLPCTHHCTALSQSDAMTFQNYTNSQVRNTMIPVPAYKNKLWSFFPTYTKIWNGLPHYFRTLTWTTLSKKAYKHNLIDWQTRTHWLHLQCPPFSLLVPLKSERFTVFCLFVMWSCCCCFFMCRRAGLILFCRAGTCRKPVFKISQACLIGIIMLLLFFFCFMKAKKHFINVKLIQAFWIDRDFSSKSCNETWVSFQPHTHTHTETQ